MLTRPNPFPGLIPGNILSTFFSNKEKETQTVITVIMKLSDDDNDDDDYEDPSNEEILDWMYADEDSRPEEDEY